jgi:acetyl esterase
MKSFLGILLLVSLSVLQVQASQPCAPVVVGNPEGNYLIPGTLGAITYRETEGRKLKLDAYVQPGSTLRPGVLVVHGGGWTSGSRIAFVGQFLELLTDSGFNWFSIDYRLAPGEKHPAAIEDLEAALDFVRCNADFFKVDPDRLALLAEDSGVQVAFMLASKNPKRVAATVGLGGFYDLSTLPFFDKQGSFDLLFGPVDNKEGVEKKLKAASPFYVIDADHPPALLIHGSQDKEAPIERARAYCEAVMETGSICKLIEVENGIHRLPMSRMDGFERTWFTAAIRTR